MMTAHKAWSGAAMAAAMAEIAYPLSEIVAAAVVGWWPGAPGDAVALVTRLLVAGVATGFTVYQIPNQERAA